MKKPINMVIPDIVALLGINIRIQKKSQVPCKIEHAQMSPVFSLITPKSRPKNVANMAINT